MLKSTASCPMALAVWLVLLGACATTSGLAQTSAEELPTPRRTTARHLLGEDATPVQAPQEAPFESAPSCRAVPTAATSQNDAIGRLWGWRNGQSCAFKDVAGHVLFYSGYVPGDWLQTPTCKSAPFADSSVADSRYKVWGWEEGQGPANTSKQLCAYKSDRQQPIPIDKNLYRLSWFDAPACIEDSEPAANNSMPDANGCLWGWQLDRNCAFKNIAVPLYYPGYNATCNTSADLASADMAYNPGSTGDFSAAQGQDAAIPPNEVTGDTANDTPGAVTSVGLIRQKSPQKIIGDDEVQQLFSGKGGSPDLNKTVTISSRDDGFTNDANAEDPGLVQDTPVPVVFDNDTSTSATVMGPSPSPAADSIPASPLPTVEVVVNITSDEAVVSDTPVPIVFDVPSNSSAIAPPIMRHFKGVSSKTLAARKTMPALTTSGANNDQPSDWSDGGPGGLAPPRHQSRSTLQRTPMLPEHQQQQSFVAAEGDAVVHKPVSESLIAEATWELGPGGISLPHPRSTAGRQIRLAAVRPATITVAEGASTAQWSAGLLNQPGPAHIMDTDPASINRLVAIPAAAATPAAPPAPLVEATNGTGLKQSVPRKLLSTNAWRRLTGWLA